MCAIHLVFNSIHNEENLIRNKNTYFSIYRIIFSQQQVTNGVLMITAAVIGLLCYFLGEAKQRRAFLEAKQSLEVKIVIEEQSAEQVTKCSNYFFSFVIDVVAVFVVAFIF